MKENNTITIRDIAAACAVSVATVSRVINHKPGVKRAVKEQVENYIHAIGWSCNNVASRINPATGRKLIVFVLSESSMFKDLLHNEECEIIDSLVRACRGENYEVLLLTGNRHELLERCVSIRPHAVVQLNSIPDLRPLEEKLTGSGIRLLTLIYQEPPTGVAIYPDYDGIGRQMAKALRRAGHRRIGFFGGFGLKLSIKSTEEAMTNRQRMILEGISAVHPEFRLERDTVGDNFGNLAGLKAVLTAGEHTGWICQQHSYAAMFLSVAYELKLRIPEALSVVTAAPVTPYLYPVDLARSCLDLKSQLRQVMELLNGMEFPVGKSFVFANSFHPGSSIAGPGSATPSPKKVR